jgi:hypothetical protein
MGLSRFINNKVLVGNPIQHLQLNIGDSGLQLDYEDPNFKLPAAIINLEDIRPYNNHPYIFQFRSGNIHRIPVLYDKEKDLQLSIQEEQFTITAVLTINCLNHMQCLDIQHQLLSVLPVGKFMHFYEFTTFLEVDDFLVNEWLFDVDADTIDNLYLKQNRFLDKLDYCFSLKVQPLVKFNDFTIILNPDTNAETFQISTSIEYLITIPVYILYPKIDFDSLIGPIKKTISRTDVSVPVCGINTNYRRITITHIEPNYNFFKTIDVPVCVDYKTNTFSGIFNFIDMNGNNVQCSLIGKVLGETINFDFDFKFEYLTTKGSGVLYYDLVKKVMTAYLTGENIKGKLSNISLNGNIMTGFFEGNCYNKQVNSNLILNFAVQNRKYKLDNMKLSCPEKKYIIIKNDELIPNNIFSSIQNIPKGCKVVADKTCIKSLTLINKYTKKPLYLNFDEPKCFDKFGKLCFKYKIKNINESTQYRQLLINSIIFKNQIKLGYNLYDYISEEEYDICIELNPISGEINVVKFCDSEDNDILPDFMINKINFNEITFELIPSITGYDIKRINVDLNWNEGSLISDGIPKELAGSDPNTRTIVISELYDLVLFDDLVKFTISLKGIALHDIHDLYWKLVYLDKFITLSNEDLGSGVFVTLNKNKNLTFTVDKNIYYDYLRSVSKSSPMFLTVSTTK